MTPENKASFWHLAAPDGWKDINLLAPLWRVIVIAGVLAGAFVVGTLAFRGELRAADWVIAGFIASLFLGPCLIARWYTARKNRGLKRSGS